MHLRESGPREAARRGTVLFLHGFPLDGSLWEGQIGSLPDGWRGLAPDLRGFGRSHIDGLPGDVPNGRKMGARIARPGEPVLTMRRLADDAAEIIETEADGPAVVCALSMGGYVAFELWRHRPDLVRALVLADTRAAADSDEGREDRRRVAHTAREEGASAIARSLVGGLLAPQTMERRPDLAAQVRDMIEATAPETIIAALAGMAGRRDSIGILPTIDVPTLVLAGEHDAITTPDDARAMAGAIPHARLEIIPRAGHLSNLENPERFNEALRTFLTSL